MTTKRGESKEEVFPVIYGELRRVARRYLGRERRNHTLQPTALVNEAWLRLQNERGAQWQGRTHGLALAAQAMRRLLVDHGRHQKRQKRGGGAQNVVLDDLIKAASTAAVPIEDLLTLEAALTRLEAVDPARRTGRRPSVFLRAVVTRSRGTPGRVGANGGKRLDARARLAQARAVGARHVRDGRICSCQLRIYTFEQFPIVGYL